MNNDKCNSHAVDNIFGRNFPEYMGILVTIGSPFIAISDERKGKIYESPVVSVWLVWARNLAIRLEGSRNFG